MQYAEIKINQDTIDKINPVCPDCNATMTFEVQTVHSLRNNLPFYGQHTVADDMTFTFGIAAFIGHCGECGMEEYVDLED